MNQKFTRVFKHEILKAPNFTMLILHFSSVSLSVDLDSDEEGTNVCVCQATTTHGGMMAPSRAGRLSMLHKKNMSMDLTAFKQKVSCCLHTKIFSVNL